MSTIAEAGSVYVSVIPSMRGFASKVNAELKGIGDVTVNVNARFDAGALRSEAAAAAAGARTSVQIDADITRASAKIDETKAKLVQLGAEKASPQVDADTAAAKAELLVFTSQLERLKSEKASVRVDADAGAATAELAAVNTEVDRVDGRRASINVSADTAAAVAALGAVLVAANSLDGKNSTVRIGVDAVQALAGLAMVTARVSALSGLVGGVSALGGAVLALGPAGAVAAGGLAAAVLGMGGVGKALTAMSAQDSASAATASQTAKQQQSAAFSIANAKESLSQASQRADQARGDAAKSVAKAEADSARAVVSAQSQVSSAQRSLSQATQAASTARQDAARSVQRAEQSAADSIASAERQVESAYARLATANATLRMNQQALTDAWEEGRRSLQDLQDQLDMGVIDQRQAALDLADARDQLAQAQAKGNPRDIAKAQVAYDRQVETIDELNKRVQRLSTDNGKAQAAGVAGSNAVVQANQQIVASQQAVRDASQAAQLADADLSKARVNGALSVADAQRNAAQSIQSADERVQSAQIALSQAQAGLAQARVDGAQRVADAQEQGARSIASADQAVVQAQRALIQALAQTGDAGQSAADKVAAAFKNLSPAAAEFARYLYSLKPALDGLKASAASGLFPPLQAGIQTLMGQFAVFQVVIGQFAAGIGAALGYVLAQLASPFWISFFQILGSVAGPILMQTAQVFMQLAGAVAQVLLALLPFTPAALGVLSAVASLVAGLAPFIGQLVGALIPAAYAVVAAFIPLGPLLAALGPVLAVLGQAFAVVLSALLQALTPVLIALTPLIQQLAMAFANQLAASLISLTPLLVSIATWMSQHPGLVLGVIGVLTTLFGAWSALRAVVGYLLGPLMLMRLAVLGLGIAATTMGATAGGAFATVIGWIGRFVGQFSFMALARTLLGGIGGAIGGVGRAILGAMGPVGWIITALGIMYSSSSSFRDAINGLLGVLGGALMGVLQAIMPLFQAVGGVLSMLAGILGGILSQVAAALVPVINVLAGVLTQLIGAILPPMSGLIGQLVPVIALLGGIFGQLLLALVPLIGVFAQLIQAILPVLVTIITQVVIPVISLLMQLFAAGLGFILQYVVVPALQLVVWALTNLLIPAIQWLAGLVGPALRGIGEVMTWLWLNVFVPAWQAIAAAFTWAWVNIIQPVVSAIWTGLKYLGAIIFVILVAPFLIAWNLISALVSWVWTSVLQPIWYGAIVPALQFLGAVFTWLYQNVVLPIWTAIGTAISWVWNTIILPVWNAIVWYVNNVTIPVMQFLYYNVILPIWNAIGATISFIWNSIILPVWNAIVWFVQNVIAPVMTWLYSNIIKPLWDAIGAAISFVWTNVINPAFQAVAGGLRWLADRFTDATNWIRDIWATIKGFLAKPINFMIDVVWNKGIVPAWNKVAGLVGIGPIQPLGLIPEYASGGPVDATAGGFLRGRGSGTSDSIVARVSNGEYVVRADVTKRHKNFLDALNAGQPEARQAAGGRNARMPGYFGGGIVEAQKFIEKSNGRPYVWGGVGPGGFDCSGYMSAVTHVLRGEGPYSRIGTTDNFPWPGFVPGLSSSWAIGATRNSGDGIGHMAGTLLGMNVESSGGVGSHSGPSARGADNGLFNIKASLPEVGGVFASGGNASGGGGFIDTISPLIRAAFDLLTNPAISLLGRMVGPPPPEWHRVPPAFATKTRDTLRDFLLSKVPQQIGGGGVMGATAADAPGITKIISDIARTKFGPLARQAAVIGVATGLVESNLSNIRGGDRDSLGVFQQRPSQGWGSPEQIMNVAYAAGSFFSRFPGNWASMDPGALAQSVQRSAFPGRYAQRMAQAQGLVAQFGGFDRGGLATGTGMMLKQTISPERVLSPRQTQTFESLLPLLSRLPDTPAALLSPGDVSSLAGDSGGGDRPLIAHLYDANDTLIGTMRGVAHESLADVTAALSDGRLVP